MKLSERIDVFRKLRERRRDKLYRQWAQYASLPPEAIPQEEPQPETGGGRRRFEIRFNLLTVLLIVLVVAIILLVVGIVLLAQSC